MSLRVYGCGKLKGETPGGEAKASLKRAEVAAIRHETRRANHEQGESPVTRTGGPNSRELQITGMTCG
jgi:hypothetical protein